MLGGALCNVQFREDLSVVRGIIAVSNHEIVTHTHDEELFVRSDISFRRPFILALCAIGGLAVSFATGCGDTTTDRKSTQTKKSELVFEKGQVGEGVDESESPPKVTSAQCLPTKTTIDTIDDFRANAFYSETTTEVEQKLKGNLNGDVAAKGVNVNWDMTAHWNSEQSTSAKTFSMLVKVRTAERSALRDKDGEKRNDEYSGKEGLICGQGKRRSPEEFLNDCGTSFIDREELGGYLVITSLLTDVESKERKELNTLSEVEAGPIGKITFDTVLKRIKKYSGNDAKFRMSSYGIAPPSGHTMRGEKVQVREIQNYINDIRSSYRKALKNNKIKSPAYGAVLEQDLQMYTYKDYSYCGVDPKLLDGFNCHQEFQAAYSRIENDRHVIQKKMEDVQMKLDNSGRYQWPKRPQGKDAQALYQDALAEVEDCLNNEIPGAQTRCENKFNAGAWDELCKDDACQIPNQCEASTLQSKLENLPDVSLRPPSTNYNEPSNYHVGHLGATRLGQISDPPKYGDTMCVLTGVGGGFYGGGEEARLRPDHGTGNWKLLTNSARTKDTEKMQAKATCVNSDNFYNKEIYRDPNRDHGWTRNRYWVKSSSGKSKKAMSNQIYPASLMGIRGNFRGGGERGRVVHKQSGPSKLWSHTDGPTITSWGMSWGLDDPGPEPTLTGGATAVSRGDDKKQLARIDEAMCFLTYVSGQLDGPSEKAHITKSGDFWNLNVNASCAKKKWGNCERQKYVKASANCYLYEQYNP